MEMKFKRDIEALADVFQFVEDYSAANAIDQSVLFTLNFVIEELFTNMVKYNVSDTHSEILVELMKEDGRLIVKLVDNGVDEFDPTKSRDVDTTQSLEERKIGGLGIHLVKKMVDSIDYVYANRQSMITVTKKLE